MPPHGIDEFCAATPRTAAQMRLKEPLTLEAMRRVGVLPEEIKPVPLRAFRRAGDPLDLDEAVLKLRYDGFEKIRWVLLDVNVKKIKIKLYTPPLRHTCATQ